MNWLPLLIFVFLAKNFTSRKKGLGSENLLSLLKIAASVKESGVLDLLNGQEPISRILSGNFPIEKLLGLFSAFSSEKNEETTGERTPTPLSEELTGEEMGRVLSELLNEKSLVSE
ncbi:MAG: hypothetical protein IKC56_03935 [Clostridia bacterium]|nr:hypothetical protein [Clostridia bacterium]